jgi:RNA polymerase sigma-70 factor, ECF subfamily
MSDQLRVAAIARGDAAAFESVFRTYFDRLQAYGERLVGRPDVAEELVGNVFARLWENRANWTLRQNLANYLYAAVRNQAIMWMEHERVVRRTRTCGLWDDRSPGMGEPPPAADEEMEATELETALRDAVERLPPRTRGAYLLSRQHGMTYAQIASEMEISSRTVENLIGRALTALRSELAAFAPERMETRAAGE